MFAVKYVGAVPAATKAALKAGVAAVKVTEEKPAFCATKVWHEVTATVAAVAYAWFFFAPAAWHTAVKGFVMTAAVAAY